MPGIFLRISRTILSRNQQKLNKDKQFAQNNNEKLQVQGVSLQQTFMKATFLGDLGVKGGDPFCDPSRGSSAHICISCVLPMKLCVFETPAMRFTISEINDATIKGLPLGLSWTVDNEK